jgi:hypothetical protein
VWRGMHSRGLKELPARGEQGGVAGTMEGYENLYKYYLAKAISVLDSLTDPPENLLDWTAGGASEAITPCLNNNDVNRMVALGAWGGRFPDEVPYW